jgi:hypothetical protein
MIRRWMRKHGSVVASVTSGTLIVALVAAIAITSTGYTAQRLDLGDGAVWVANSAQQAIGRANTEVLELNSVVASTGDDLEVLQEGTTVLLLDRSGNELEIVDPATSESIDSVALPPNQPEVHLAGDRVVIFEAGTGELWVVPVETLADFDAESEATLSLGADATISVDSAGLLHAYAPAAGLLYRVNTRISDAVDLAQPLDLPSTSNRTTLTSVAGRWALLDASTDTVYLEGRTVELGDLLGAGTGAVLQTPSVDGDRVLIGFSGGLISIPLSGASAVGLVDGMSGLAARPFVVDGCEFGAWTNGATWRRCADDGGAGRILTLPDMGPTAQLAFQANGSQALLNDEQSGASWAVQREGQLINNWNELIVDTEDDPEEQQNQDDAEPEVERVQQPPVAIDDAFGARPGRSTILPVLLNDYDPNGDVLVVGELAAIDPAIGRIDLVNERQQIQITLAPGVSGGFSFDYVVTDGRGGTDTARVSISVRAPGENSPPQQVRSTRAVAETGGRVTVQVLSDWVDPDGDAFYLTEAAVAEPDSVTYKPNGEIVFSDSGQGGNLKIVALAVSDGSAIGSGTAAVSVRDAGDVPIIADPFVLLAYAGQEITVSPLDHVRGGSGTIRLNSVPSKPDVTVTPSYDNGTFRFTSDEVRSHYLEYVVTDGTVTATGVVRIDVASPPDANTKPITVPKTVFVKSLRNERIDVAGTDVDPAGGVLLVTGILNLAPGSGVRAEVLDQRLVRVSLEAPLDDGPVTFNYRISNGLAEAEGVITVIEIPNPSQLQPPVAVEDTVTVRVGDAIDIPVLRNDEHPDGAVLTLQPQLDQELPDDAGLIFASGNVLRYLAPDRTGNFTASYRVTGPDGQAATALVRISVREADIATNNAPVPATVTARVLAGETVRVRIPLAGTDPDGDSVQLLGQASNPQKGAVVGIENDTIIYRAGDYSAGTDTFGYEVIDALGARSIGTVRIGISARLDGARNPVAIVDEVIVRPGVTVSVQVLANDSDPDGSALTVVSAEPNDDVTTAEVVDDLVQVTPPAAPGVYGVIYAIENETGGSSQNFIRVRVDPNAPLSYPIASDTVLTLSDILDRDTVTIDALARVFFADGDPRSLGLSIFPGYGDQARITSDKLVEVSVSERSQIIPFKVTHPDDPDVFSYGFIRVPGLDDALPQIDRRAPALRVNSEEQLVIDLNDYVIAVGGKQVSLTDTSTVEATNSNGDDLVRDDDTLVFTSADKYFGPASISFEVTDATSPTDAAARTAIIVLPITVLPRENQPPGFVGAVIDFEPGQEKLIDLLKLTDYPYDDVDELVYSVLEPLPVGFSYSLSGSLLTLTADPSAVKGTLTTMQLAVRDDLSEGRPGRIELSVVPSTRPLAQPAADSVITKRGESTPIDVLANDQATNPFPGEPLRVVDIRGIEGGSLPAGVTVTPSADNSTLTATISSTAQPGDVTLQYQVEDATGDADRRVWGSVTISIQDRPDPVDNLQATAFADRSVSLRWNPAQFNNSPITGYRVVTTSGGSTIATDVCTGTTCTLATPGNGPANAVRYAVFAVNAIGESDPVTLADPVWSDIVPAAPTGLSAEPLDQGLRVIWDEVPTPAGGSAVTGYVVTVGGVSVTSSCAAATCSVNLTDGSIANGVPVTFSVSARNGAYGPLASWNTASGQATPAGPPIATASPLASATGDTSISLDWSAAFNNNGRPITDYTAAAYTASPPTCAPDGTITSNGATVIATGAATSTAFSGLNPNAEYQFVVIAFNGQGCTVGPSVIARTAPSVITALTVVGPSPNGATFDFVVTGGSMSGTPITSDFTLIYRLSGGSVQGGESGPVSLGSALTANGTQYGQTISVEARACRTWDSTPVCQTTWSAPFLLGVPVDPRLLTDPSFTQLDPDDPRNDGTFAWLGLPVGAYEAISVACGTAPGGPFIPATDPGTCDVTANPAETPFLTIRVTANGGQTYDITYNGFDYD